MAGLVQVVLAVWLLLGSASKTDDVAAGDTVFASAEGLAFTKSRRDDRTYRGCEISTVPTWRTSRSSGAMRATGHRGLVFSSTGRSQRRVFHRVRRDIRQDIRPGQWLRFVLSAPPSDQFVFSNSID